MKLIATALAGAALIVLAGCNRAQPAANSADNATADVAENTAAAPADAGAKPAATNAAAPADASAAEGKPTGGEAPAEDATVNSGEDGK